MPSRQPRERGPIDDTPKDTPERIAVACPRRPTRLTLCDMPPRSNPRRWHSLLISIFLMAVPLIQTAAAATIHAAIARSSRATSFVLADDGRLWCWGSNDDGQYGDGTTDSRLSGRPATSRRGDGVALVRAGVALLRNRSGRTPLRLGRTRDPEWDQPVVGSEQSSAESSAAWKSNVEEGGAPRGHGLSGPGAIRYGH